MFYEFRQYTIAEGRRDEWVELMEKVIIPFQVSCGMVVLGSFVDEEQPDIYYWMRRFNDEAERERLYAAVYDSETWRNEIAPKTGEMLKREMIVVKRIVPTSRSVVQ
jgi:hypothetical protein